MNHKLASTYNQISDVFSRSQIKNAVESLDRYSDRVKLIDSIIERRQQIRQANDLSKIAKYAHIFRKMIQRYKNKKEEEQAKQREQMQIVMSMFNKSRRSPRNFTKKFDLITNKSQTNNNNNQQFKLTLTSTKGYNQKNHYSSRAQRFLSADNGIPTQIKFLKQQEQEISSLESKIRQSFILKTRINLYQSIKEQDKVLQVMSKLSISPIKRSRNFKPSELLSQKNLTTDNKVSREHLHSQIIMSESFVSSSERKLDSLYSTNRKLISTKLPNIEQLQKVNQEIFDVSNKKLNTYR